ncbi:hypothetical protein Tco_1269287, partial [Tanacetum coccineum]
MMTRSAGLQTAAPRGGRTGGRTSREGGRIGEPMGRVGGQTGDQDGQRGDRGIKANGGINKVPDFSTVIAQQLQDLLPTIITQVGNHASNIQDDVRSVNMNNGRNGCSYKDFLACNPKDYDGKGGAIAYTHWIEKMESVQTRGQEAAVGMTCEDFKLARLVPNLVTPENKRTERNGSLKKNTEKRGNGGELSRDRNVRDDTKRSRTGRAFATTTNLVRR